MAVALVTAIVGLAGQGSGRGDGTESPLWEPTSERHFVVGVERLAQPRSEKCLSAHKAVRFYARRLNQHRAKMGARPTRTPASLTPCPRYLARVLQRKAFVWRTRAERWIAQHVLRDFRPSAGANAWRKAVQEAQKPYPGTAAWLMSCSASEGGWGRWVPNSQGSGVGGWMQMYPSTFARMFGAASFDLARRGYIVPASAHSWYSPLGQALASAWGYLNGRRHEWHGAGC